MSDDDDDDWNLKDFWNVLIHHRDDLLRAKINQERNWVSKK